MANTKEKSKDKEEKPKKPKTKKLRKRVRSKQGNNPFNRSGPESSFRQRLLLKRKREAEEE